MILPFSSAGKNPNLSIDVPTAMLKGLLGIRCSLSETLLLREYLEVEGVMTQLFRNIGDSAIFERSAPPAEDLTALPSLIARPLIAGDIGKFPENFTALGGLSFTGV